MYCGYVLTELNAIPGIDLASGSFTILQGAHRYIPRRDQPSHAGTAKGEIAAIC
jgi:hypothetical protein